MYKLIRRFISRATTTAQPTYEELLQDERWKNKRKEILELGGYKCKYCGRTEGLQVHHKYYNKYPNNQKVDPWDYPNNALECLCEECHKWWHSQNTVKLYYRRFGEHY